MNITTLAAGALTAAVSVLVAITAPAAADGDYPPVPPATSPPICSEGLCPPVVTIWPEAPEPTMPDVELIVPPLPVVVWPDATWPDVILPEIRTTDTRPPLPRLLIVDDSQMPAPVVGTPTPTPTLPHTR